MYYTIMLYALYALILYGISATCGYNTIWERMTFDEAT